MFKIDANALLSLSLDEVKARFDNPANRKKLGELTFFDLLVENPGANKNKLRSMNFGVYVFFNSAGQCAYVGKTNKQGFAERIGSNFGLHRQSQGNIYLSRTLSKDNPTSKREPVDFAEQVQKMGDHSITMVHISAWQDAGEMLKPHCKFDQWDGWHNWVPKFVTVLEKTLQAIYCPTEPKPKPELDHFLIQPIRGRGVLRRHQKEINKLAGGGAKFAEIIAQMHFNRHG